jgi:hypothetical protein
MRWVVRPLAAAAGTTDSPHSADTADSAGATRTTDPSDTPNSARTACTADAANSANTAGTACTTDSADSTDPSYSADATNASNASNASNSTYAPDSTDASATTATGPVAAANIGIAVEVVIHVDIDITTAPAAAPAPAAPCGTPRETETKPYGSRGPDGSGAVVIRRVIDRWVGVPDRTVRVHRVIRRHIKDLGIRRLYNDHLLAFDHLRLDLHLLVRYERPFIFRLRAHPLHGIHHVLLLSDEGVAEVGRPLNVLRKPLDHIGQRGHRLNTRVPGLLRHRGVQFLLVLRELGIVLQPLVKLDQFERISRCHQNLREQIVRIERDRCHKRIKLFGRDLCLY